MHISTSPKCAYHVHDKKGSHKNMQLVVVNNFFLKLFSHDYNSLFQRNIFTTFYHHFNAGFFSNMHEVLELLAYKIHLLRRTLAACAWQTHLGGEGENLAIILLSPSKMKFGSSVKKNISFKTFSQEALTFIKS